MPKTGHPGVELWKRLLARYGDVPRDIARATKIDVAQINQFKYHQRVTAPYLDHVRSILDQGEAQGMQTKRAPKEVPMPDPELARRLVEFALLVVMEPGFKDILLRHRWDSLDQDTIAEVVRLVEEGKL